MKRVLIPFAEGMEELECATLTDILTRAGAMVVTASISHNIQVACSRGLRIQADHFLYEVQDQEFDLIVLPGGMEGAKNYARHAGLKQLFLQQKAQGKAFGAICASPALALSAYGVLSEHAATCYPGMQDKLQAKEFRHEPVVQDGLCFTSQGPATAMAYALTLVEYLFGAAKRAEVAQGLLYPA